MCYINKLALPSVLPCPFLNFSLVCPPFFMSTSIPSFSQTPSFLFPSFLSLHPFVPFFMFFLTFLFFLPFLSFLSFVVSLPAFPFSFMSFPSFYSILSSLCHSSPSNRPFLSCILSFLPFWFVFCP
ncbi:hypothetical protein ATANTOWER_004313 [Ataeniobius toweri]|uniref:Uncharacterized protein n=1 Tax=Ataeniobius toweri TaxID=208326 RepID=A0ABU7AD51_9TELE|nr:hypothetical protein [Ataeniobius toweri]